MYWKVTVSRTSVQLHFGQRFDISCEDSRNANSTHSQPIFSPLHHGSDKIWFGDRCSMLHSKNSTKGQSGQLWQISRPSWFGWISIKMVYFGWTLLTRHTSRCYLSFPTGFMRFGSVFTKLCNFQVTSTVCTVNQNSRRLAGYKNVTVWNLNLKIDRDVGDISRNISVKFQVD